MKGDRSFALWIALFSSLMNLSIGDYLLKYNDSHVLNDSIVLLLDLEMTIFEQSDFDLSFPFL